MSNSESASDDEPAGADVRWSALTLDQLVEEYWGDRRAGYARRRHAWTQSETPAAPVVQSTSRGSSTRFASTMIGPSRSFCATTWVGITPRATSGTADDDAVATALDGPSSRSGERRLADSTVEGTRSRLAAIRSALRAAG